MKVIDKEHFRISQYLIDLQSFDLIKTVFQSDHTSCILVNDKENSKQYLVKTFKNLNYQDNNDCINNFILTLAQFQHPTFIKFHGYSYKDFNGKLNFSVVLDYTKNGSLSSFLQNCRKSSLQYIPDHTFSQIILIGITRSMFLLNKNRKYNGNLKPENILLDKNLYPLLTDFVSPHESNKIQFTVYDSPEVLDNQNYNEKSDVYSFGIIMYEIVTLLEPFSELSKLNSYQKCIKIKQGQRPEFKTEISLPIKELIERCWSSNVDERPSFEELFYKLAYDRNYYIGELSIEKIMNYIKLIKYDLKFCTICHKSIGKDDLVYYSRSFYHKNCVECSICHKTAESDDEFICVAPDLFFCKKDYHEIENPEVFSKENHDEYQNKMMSRIIDDTFNPADFNNDQILDSEMIQNSFQIHVPYKYLVPLITIHYGTDPKNVDFNKLQELLGNDMIIVGAKKGSIILQIAFIASNASDELNTNHKKIISSIKNKLESSLIDIPICDNNFFNDKRFIPDKNKMIEFFKKKSFNHLQNFDFLDSIKIEELKNNVCLKLKNNYHKKNWEFMFQHQELFDQIEKQVRKDIKNNKIEMIIIGQTVIVNKYIDEYQKIKNLLQGNACERILYHGSRLSNHYGIIKEHFKDPSCININEKHDEGFYGKGIYATDNIYYSTFFADYFYDKYFCRYLEENDQTSIFCCLSIYNKKSINEVNGKITGSEIDQDIENKYGINHVFVGDRNCFHKTLTKDECEKEIVGSEEFVFPNKFQIIPLLSLKVKRAEYLILWKDENIYNKENTKFWKAFKKKHEANVYLATSNEEALDIIKLKRHNKIKLITNGGKKCSGEKCSGEILINEARKIMNSDFIVLVFARNKKHIDWIRGMKNVIFTIRPSVFNEFVELDMKENLILDFVKKCEKENNTEFNINKNSLFKFPNYFNENYRKKASQQSKKASHQKH